MADESPKKATESKRPTHPIGVVIDNFDHAVRDIEASLIVLMPKACEFVLKNSKDAIAEMEDAIKQVEAKNDQTRHASFARLDAAFSRLERIEKTKIPFRLQECLFVGLFSVYDAYFGNLLQQIFKKKPTLYECIRSEIKTSEILKFSSINQLKEKIIDDFVDDIRRKSYIDQFSQLESIFSIPLRKFLNWPVFIEAAQRRNLLTHCDGVVSEQYLKVCSEVGYKFLDGNVPKVGSKLELEPEYFVAICLVVQEVGIKLAHTLWRKIFDDELEVADEYLSDMIYGNLKNNRLKVAVCLGEFAYTQKKISSEHWKLVIAVNYCIGLLQSGEAKQSANIINSFDLTSALPEFKLARAVLLRDFKKAATIMRKIGKQGEFVHELSYLIWPLFHEFRGRPEFQSAYKDIYGYEFLTEVKKAVSEKKSALKLINQTRDKISNVVEPENVATSVKSSSASRKKTKKHSSVAPIISNHSPSGST